MMFKHYSSPDGFNFDSSDFVDDNNKEYKANEFKNWVEKMRAIYKSNHIFIPMGDDFTYSAA